MIDMLSTDKSNSDLRFIVAAMKASELVYRNGHIIKSNGSNAEYLSLDGYVLVWYKNRRALAHRAVWCYHHGEIPAGCEINHLDLDKQNNLDGNLEITTHAGNTQHRVQLMGTPWTWGRQRTKGKLKDRQIRQIRNAALKGERQRSIARRYGLCQQMVSLIVSRKRFPDV